MNQGYRDDLAAAQARIVELEDKLARGGASPALDALEREHAALVRSVPSRARVGLMTGLAGFVALISVVSMLFLSSSYDQHPRFTIAMQMIVICGMTVAAFGTWLARVGGLEKVVLTERLLAAERARSELESRVRVADATRVAAFDEAEPAESESSPASARMKK